jgi:hypothetical protein
MIFGHNTNVNVDGTVYHVQTEEHGAANALIDTTVYCRGRVLHRRTNNYFDLLPLNADREGALKPPPAPAAPGPSALALELVNATSWLAGKRATLQIAVRHKENGGGVAGAEVAAKIDGAATPGEFKTKTGKDGQARLEFDMPRLAGAESALVIEARDGAAKAHLRFQLRAKPGVRQA